MTIVKVVEKLHDVAKNTGVLNSAAAANKEVPLPSSMQAIVAEAHAEATEAKVSAMETGKEADEEESSAYVN